MERRGGCGSKLCGKREFLEADNAGARGVAVLGKSCRERGTVHGLVGKSIMGGVDAGSCKKNLTDVD